MSIVRMGLGILLIAIIGSASAATRSRAADDTIVLRDGVQLSGQITKEDKEAVFIRESNGEEHGVERVDIAKILRNGVEDKPAVKKPADVIAAMKSACASRPPPARSRRLRPRRRRPARPSFRLTRSTGWAHRCSLNAKRRSKR